MTAPRWNGAQGWVVLGPAEDRVARYLDHATRHGRITLRTSRVQADLALGRSEAFRILRQLRTLGLFGIENDQGGTNGGRRIWRTRRPRAAALDPARHRQAWARVVAAAAAFRQRILDRVRRHRSTPAASGVPPLAPATAGPEPGPASVQSAQGPPATMRDAMLRWAPALAAEWRIDR